MSLTSKGVILSLCDVSGTWSQPYVELGYTVIRVDPKHGDWEDLYQSRGLIAEACGTGELVPMADGGYGLSWSVQVVANILLSKPDYFGAPVVGILMAPPCTDFSSSGSRHWPGKDADGRTAASVSIVKSCLFVKDTLKPTWWVLENPVGRLRRLVPEVGSALLLFHPSDYASWADDPDSEAYTKKTCLFGDFNPDLPKNPREPKMVTLKNGKRGSWMWAKLGGKSEKTKALRSKTPQGFSRAFARANP